MLWTIAISLLAGTLSVILAIGLIRLWDRWRSDAAGTVMIRHQPTVFLFKNNELIDATLPARSLLNHISAPIGDWQRLLSWLELRFDDVVEKIGRPNRPDRIELTGSSTSDAAKLRLVIENLGDDVTRVELSDLRAAETGAAVDSVSLQAIESELGLLRDALDHTPTLIWRQDNKGQITWANAAYIKQVELVHKDKIDWPLPRLLDPPDIASGNDAEAAVQGGRAKMDFDEDSKWYDCHVFEIGGQKVFYALPADAAVRAERNLREFVQTLTMTFAGLHVGLAIFDRDRNLQLFNPALLELTGLPISLLATRPTLVDFLDHLREHRMLPEPKDYRSWRSRISNLEIAAKNGQHVEEWSLSNGRTYRVTGSPHPDGAVAFLFEDITGETRHAREARASQKLSRTIIDSLDEALAVFGPNGQLILANRAYRENWDAEINRLPEAIDAWRSGIRTDHDLDALRDHLLGEIKDDHSNGALTGMSGQTIAWTITHIGGGQRLICFRQPESGKPDQSRPITGTPGKAVTG